MALYQLRLKRRNGSTATNCCWSTRFMVSPDRKAYGSQM